MLKSFYSIFIDEGQSINLSDFFHIEHDDVQGEIIKLY